MPTALLLALLTSCAAGSSDPPIIVVNACDKIRVADHSDAFQAKVADQIPTLPPESQQVIVDAGLTHRDVRACRSVKH